jgi:hypothetical protein
MASQASLLKKRKHCSYAQLTSPAKFVRYFTGAGGQRNEETYGMAQSLKTLFEDAASVIRDRQNGNSTGFNDVRHLAARLNALTGNRHAFEQELSLHERAAIRSAMQLVPWPGAKGKAKEPNDALASERLRWLMKRLRGIDQLDTATLGHCGDLCEMIARELPALRSPRRSQQVSVQ